MFSVRARALRSAQATFGRAVPRVSAPRAQLVAKRFASGGAHAPASSDMPWLISALVITPISCYYLWPSASSAEHHGHGDHAKHEEAHEEEEKEEEPAAEEKSEEAAPEETEEKPEEKSEEKSEEKEEKSEDSPSKGESEPTSTTTTGKDGFNEDSDANNATRKVESGNKGSDKVRKESGLGKNLGEGINSSQSYNDSDGAKIDSDMVEKQAHLSNTDTRHSVAIDEPGSEKSTKGMGGPETAKAKGTVDPSSPVK